MTNERHETLRALTRGAIVLAALLLGGCGAAGGDRPGELLQVGEMRTAIGMGQDEGRVGLGEIAARPHFYGVGALEGLRGEITVLDSHPIATAVAENGSPLPLTGAEEEATLLVGRSIPRWRELALDEPVAPGGFDATVGALAAANGVDVTAPFVFVVEGEFTDLRLHVINGACPIHARNAGIELAEDERPFVREAERIAGTLVGVHAENSTGRLTHPGTSVHAHLVTTDAATGRRVTGHLERVGLARGAVLKLPESGSR
jgi:hypothetical protein